RATSHLDTQRRRRHGLSCGRRTRAGRNQNAGVHVRTQFRLSSGTTAALDNQATSGAVVLFVPGYTGSKEDFMPLLRPLANAGYRAVAIDQRGQYESSWAG